MRANYGSWASTKASVFHLLTAGLCCFGCFPTPSPSAGNNRPKLMSAYTGPTADLDIDFINETTTAAPSHRLPCTREEERITRCVNKGKCFVVIIKEQRHEACHCPEGFTGRRCEEKVTPTQDPNSASVLIWVFGVLAVVIVLALVAFFIWHRFCRNRASSQRRSVPQKAEYDHAKQLEEVRKYELQLSGQLHTSTAPPPLLAGDSDSESLHLDMNDDLPDQYEKIVGGPIVTPTNGTNRHHQNGRPPAHVNGRVTDV